MLDVEGELQTLPISPGLHRYTRLEAVKVRAKHVPAKKQSKKLVDKSKLAPLNGGKRTKGYEIGPSIDIIEDVAVMPLRKDVESIIGEEDASLNFSNSPLATKREVVLRACVSTCAAISSAGVLIQQITHWAAESGWPVPDSTSLLAYHVESWHLGVMLGLVGIVSIARQLLVGVWPEFSESSNVANEEVLGPLRLGDYAIVAVLPGISEELLFRGALLPLFGLDWKGVTITGILFGVLHLTGGRKAAFATWASIVGILYGLGCVATHSVLIPMAAHSANNLIGAIIWKLRQRENYFRAD